MPWSQNLSVGVDNQMVLEWLNKHISTMDRKIDEYARSK